MDFNYRFKEILEGCDYTTALSGNVSNAYHLSQVQTKARLKGTGTEQQCWALDVENTRFKYLGLNINAYFHFNPIGKINETYPMTQDSLYVNTIHSFIYTGHF
jgi:hypothetical protein